MNSCSKCGRSLISVDGTHHRRKNDFPQFDNAIVIDFRGGYGMYLDVPPTRTVLCNECAANFFTINKWVWLFIQLYSGNTD